MARIGDKMKEKELNYHGFGVIAMSLEDFMNKMEDKETLEVIKTNNGTMLYRLKTNELYVLELKGEENENSKF